MDTIISAIRDYSKRDSDLDNLKKLLGSRIEAIARQGNGSINSAVEALDPKKHTLGYTFLLYAKVQNPILDAVFVPQVERLLLNLDVAQARKTDEKLGGVVNRYTEVLRETNPARGIPVLKKALTVFRLSSEHLTPLHADFVSLCLKAHNYKAALPILETRIFQVDPKRSGVTPKDLLLYFYYGAMVYTGLKQYEKAMYFYETVLNAPASTLTAIMVEAFKKYVLVSLLSTGKAPSMASKTAPSVVHRHLKAYANEYVELGNAYETRQVAKVTEIITKHTEVFTKDNNFGLVKQCLKALYRTNIQKLTQTYLTLSLTGIAETVGLPSARDAELQVLKMINDGEILASINQEAGMVEFKDDNSSFIASSTSDMIDRRIETTVDLSNKLRLLDEEIASSNAFVARSHGLREEMFMDLGGGSGMSALLGAAKLGRMFEIFRT